MQIRGRALIRFRRDDGAAERTESALNKLAQRMEQFVRPQPLYDFERDLQRN